jgi:xanthine dehydrogenase accessory factor
VVVAGLGRDEERAIRAALDAGVPYVALVASHKRGAVVLDGMGLTPGERTRVRPHAGLDIGARTPKEIALSILAEIVRELRAEGLAAPDDMVHPPEPDAAVSTVPSYPQGTDTITPKPEIMTSGGSPGEGGVGGADDHAAGSPSTADAAVPSTSGPAIVTISAGPPRQAIDPVCGMTVFIDDDTPHAVVDGQDYWFCRVGCRDSFVAG